MQKPHGTIKLSCSPPGNGNGGGSGLRPREPSGEIRGLDHGKHYPIYLSTATLWKLSIPALSAIVAVVYFYVCTQEHIKNPDIHIRAESKQEAKVTRDALLVQIKEQSDLTRREVRVETATTMQVMTKKITHDITEELKVEQRRILNEVVRARRAIER